MALNLEDLQSHFNTGLSGGSGGESGTFTPEEGETQIRLLPPWDKLTNKLFKKVGYHTIEGTGRQLCPREIDNMPCPICEVVFKLYKSKDQEDIAKAREWRAVRRFYWNIIVRNEEKKGVQKFGCGIKLAQRINDIIFKELAKDITDPTDGHDIMLVKQKIGDFPDYSRSYPIHQPSLLGNNEWLEDLYDLDKDFTPRSYADLKEVIEQQLSPTTISVSTTVHETPMNRMETPPPVNTVAETPAPIETKVESPEAKVATPDVNEAASTGSNAGLSPDEILKMLHN